ncbi:MAG: DUF4349 domain-containing protein [Actinomycetota bacterium]|nr:DUF4349 domain-containing protein [Actinomycetota bacterium]
MFGNSKKGKRTIVFVGLVLACLIVVSLVVGIFSGGERKKESGLSSDEVKENPVDGAKVDRNFKGDSAVSSNEEQVSNAGIPSVPKTIKTGSMQIEIGKGTYEEAYIRVSEVASGSGGYVSDSQSNSSNGRMTGGTITIRVPGDKFREAMKELKKIGKVTSVSEQAEDVGEEYVDLESRIRNLKSQESVYLSLMGKAKTIEESISIQRELTNIQGQIEQLVGRKNYLDNRIDLSSITITLLEKGAQPSPGEGWGFIEALKAAARNIVEGFNEILRFIGSVLPYVLLIAVLALLVWYLLKKEKRSSES